MVLSQPSKLKTRVRFPLSVPNFNPVYVAPVFKKYGSNANKMLSNTVSGLQNYKICALSSMVEPTAHNGLVVGSSPTGHTK